MYSSIYMYQDIENIKNQQCENLKKKLRGVNTCCFLTIPVNIFAK